MTHRKTRIVGNKDFCTTVLLILIIGTVAIFNTGCGGGGGNTPAAVASNEYANVSMTAPTGRISPGLTIITLAGSTASGNTVRCRITNFGDGSQNQTEWFDCNGSAGISFQHVYANATTNDLTRTISVEAKNSAYTTSRNFNIVISPPVATNPAVPSPTATGFSCEADTITVGQSISCSANGTCPINATCFLVVDYGDGSQGTFTGINTQNISHTYTTTSINDITYTLSVYATNGQGGPQSAILNHNIRVRQGSLTAPEALRLSTSLDFTQVGNDPYRFRIGTICKNSSCTINGTLSTNVDKAYVKTAAGQESEVTVNKSNWTWSYTVNVADGEEAVKSFVFWGEDAQESEGPKITVDQKVDRKKPDVPTVFPVTSPTTLSSQIITGTKPKCASVWRGTTQIAAVTDTDNCSLLDNWSETVSFNSYSTYSYSYFSKDTAGNQSNTVTVQINHNTSGGGGGGTCGDNSCNNGETCSSCSSDCGSCSTDCDNDNVCDSNETCSSCSNDCGSCSSCDNDGVCDSNENYTSCSNDCATTSGSYQLVNTYTAASESSIAWGSPLDTDYIFSVRASAKCVDQYALPDGNKTSFCTSLTNMNYSFREPNSIVYCKGDDRIIVGDPTYNAGGDTTLGRISVFNKPAEDSMFHVSHFDTPMSTDTRVICDESGNLLIIGGSNDPSIRKVSRTSGANINPAYTTGLSNPIGATYDSSNNVFVADAGNCRITKLTSSMNYDSDANQKWDDTSCGTDSSKFTTILGIAANDVGKVFVLDCGRSDGCRVQIFANDGTYESEFSVNSNASAITATKSGTNTEVYVANRTNGKIYKYTPR